MPAPLDSLTADALVLSPEERVTLAHRLLASVEAPADPAIEAAWEAEMTERVARFDAGETQAIPAEEVFRRLRAIAPGA